MNILTLSKLLHGHVAFFVDKHLKRYSWVSFFAILAVLCSFIPVQAAGGSGACSSHGGVNCSAGSDWDGSVICRDGWRDSSVYFFEVIECKQSRLSCTTEEWNLLNEKYGIAELEQKMADLNSSLRTGLDQISDQPIAMPFITGQQAALERRIAAQIEALATEQNNRLRLIIKECEALGQKRINKELQTMAERELQTLREAGERQGVERCLSMNAEHKADGMCYCRAGYQLNSDRNYCIKPPAPTALSCATYGPNAVLTTNDKCVCAAGYEWDTGKTWCMKNLQCADGYVKKNGQCLTYTQDCSLLFGTNVFGTKSVTNDSSCWCSTGYQWNAPKTACVVVPAPTITQCPGGSFLDSAGSCVCADGYFWDTGLKICSRIIISTPPTAVIQPITSSSFIGIPTNKADLLRCSIVAKKATRLYYSQGHKIIKQMTPIGKECFSNEQEAKKKGFKKGR